MRRDHGSRSGSREDTTGVIVVRMAVYRKFEGLFAPDVKVL